MASDAAGTAPRPARTRRRVRRRRGARSPRCRRCRSSFRDRWQSPSAAGPDTSDPGPAAAPSPPPSTPSPAAPTAARRTDLPGARTAAGAPPNAAVQQAASPASAAAVTAAAVPTTSARSASRSSGPWNDTSGQPLDRISMTSSAFALPHRDGQLRDAAAEPPPAAEPHHSAPQPCPVPRAQVRLRAGRRPPSRSAPTHPARAPGSRFPSPAGPRDRPAPRPRRRTPADRGRRRAPAGCPGGPPRAAGTSSSATPSTSRRPRSRRRAGDCSRCSGTGCHGRAASPAAGAASSRSGPAATRVRRTARAPTPAAAPRPFRWVRRARSGGRGPWLPGQQRQHPGDGVRLACSGSADHHRRPLCGGDRGGDPLPVRSRGRRPVVVLVAEQRVQALPQRLLVDEGMPDGALVEYPPDGLLPAGSTGRGRAARPRPCRRAAAVAAVPPNHPRPAGSAAVPSTTCRRPATAVRRDRLRTPRRRSTSRIRVRSRHTEPDRTARTASAVASTTSSDDSPAERRQPQRDVHVRGGEHTGLVEHPQHRPCRAAPPAPRSSRPLALGGRPGQQIGQLGDQRGGRCPVEDTAAGRGVGADHSANEQVLDAAEVHRRIVVRAAASAGSDAAQRNTATPAADSAPASSRRPSLSRV